MSELRPEDFDDIPDDFWDVEEALDFTGSGKIFTTIKNSLAAKVIAIIAAAAAIAVIVIAAIFISGRVKRVCCLSADGEIP